MHRTDLEITNPCERDWHAMSPRGTGRFCGDCKKVVHDLSKLREPEARRLLASPPTEGLCIRYLHDEHGTVWFEDTRVMRTEGLLKKVAAAAALAAAPLLTACMGASPYDSYDSSYTSGPTDFGRETAQPSVGDGGDAAAATDVDGSADDTDGGASPPPCDDDASTPILR